MTRTKGFRVKIWKQAPSGPTASDAERADYLTEDGEPKLFATKRAARDAADAYVRDKPELTYALEPDVL